MADPVYPVTAGAHQWTKIVTNVVSGIIRRKDTTSGLILQTYRMTGEAAPTDPAEGVPLFQEYTNFEKISAPAAIDIYVYPTAGNAVFRIDA